MPYERHLIWELKKVLPDLELEEGWSQRAPYEKQEIIIDLLRALFETNPFMRRLSVDVTYVGISTPGQGELIEVHILG